MERPQVLEKHNNATQTHKHAANTHRTQHTMRTTGLLGKAWAGATRSCTLIVGREQDHLSEQNGAEFIQ